MEVVEEVAAAAEEEAFGRKLLVDRPRQGHRGALADGQRQAGWAKGAAVARLLKATNLHL